jgi:phospholipase/carboxylesterase
VSDGSGSALPDDYARPLAAVGAATLGALEALEAAARRLHPPSLPQLRARVGPVHARLLAAVEAFRRALPPAGLEAFHDQLARGADAALDATRDFVTEGAPGDPSLVLRALRHHCRAQALLYPLRGVLPPLGRYYAEPEYHAELERLDRSAGEAPPRGGSEAGASVGLHVADGPGKDGRGGFSLYVPERHAAGSPRPLVVALHGGFGHGRDFLWTWLREARGRDCLVLAPSSRGSTWALDSPAAETAALAAMVAFVRERWSVDPERILLTGLSDGATFALLAGLAEGAPYTALAPVSGVLHPLVHRLGNLARARGRRIYLVHGALDWLFPVALARLARDALAQAGADLTYRELEDLSHAYPREENAAILRWLGA